MAYIIVKNSLSEYVAARININIPKFTPVGQRGDSVFTIEVATTYTSISGTKIKPTYRTLTESYKNVDSLIEDAVSEISDEIDWGELYEDTKAPYVVESLPIGNDVKIESNINVSITDKIPAAGIDMSEAKIYLDNGHTEFDITSECLIEGNPFHYDIKWSPNKIVRNLYEA